MMTPPSQPDRIGRYEVLLPIASGGMATVYLARSRSVGGFEREVAVKVTHEHLRQAGDPSVDLLEEAKLAALIHHPNVVAVLDVGEDATGFFLTMEYVEGDTLSSLVRKSDGAGLPLGIGLRVVLDALAGLHAAHELTNAEGRHVALVHRDFSPQNILVGLDGVSRLADFGVAKALGRATHTRTGFIKGKIGYMAPEQARGEQIDRRCDVWAAGVIAWEILAGRRLHESENDAITLLALVTEEPARLSTVREDIPEALVDAVARALTMSPAQRWTDAASFARAIVAGCRSSDVRIAEKSEVADHVAALVGAKIEKRRERVRRISELRAKVDVIARAEQEGRSPAPPGKSVPPPLPERGEATPLSTPVPARAAGGRGLSATVLVLGALLSSTVGGAWAVLRAPPQLEAARAMIGLVSTASAARVLLEAARWPVAQPTMVSGRADGTPDAPATSAAAPEPTLAPKARGDKRRARAPELAESPYEKK